MSGPRAWLARLWRSAVVAPVLVSLAKRDVRRGDFARAKARLLRGVALAPASFQAHFGLACIYLRERDPVRARAELALAREIAPGRYRAYQARLPELVARPGITVAVGADAGGCSQSGIAGDRGPFAGLEPPYPGDFASREEWERFRRLGPITPGEAARVDWDGLIAALTDDVPPAGGSR